jgi:hypothetical protein
MCELHSKTSGHLWLGLNDTQQLLGYWTLLFHCRSYVAPHERGDYANECSKEGRKEGFVASLIAVSRQSPGWPQESLPRFEPGIFNSRRFSFPCLSPMSLIPATAFVPCLKLCQRSRLCVSTHRFVPEQLVTSVTFLHFHALNCSVSGS